MCDLREPNSFKRQGRCFFFLKQNLITLYFPQKWSYWRKVFLLLNDNFSKKRTFLAQKQNHLFPVCKRESTETSPTRKQVRTKQTNKKHKHFFWDSGEDGLKRNKFWGKRQTPLSRLRETTVFLLLDLRVSEDSETLPQVRGSLGSDREKVWATAGPGTCWEVEGWQPGPAPAIQGTNHHSLPQIWGGETSHISGRKEVPWRLNKGKRQAKSRKECGMGKVLFVKHTLISKVAGLWCCPKQKTYMVCKIYSISRGNTFMLQGFSLGD